MNSVFNLATHNLNQMTDDELLTWLHSEGLANMPPIIRSLAYRLEAVQNDVAYAEEETKEIKEKYEKLDKDTLEGLNQLDDRLGRFASNLEKVSNAILEAQSTILLLDGTLIDHVADDEESPEDRMVVSRGQLDAFRKQIDSIGYALSNLETGDFFPARPQL